MFAAAEINIVVNERIQVDRAASLLVERLNMIGFCLLIQPVMPFIRSYISKAMSTMRS